MLPAPICSFLSPNTGVSVAQPPLLWPSQHELGNFHWNSHGRRGERTMDAPSCKPGSTSQDAFCWQGKWNRCLGDSFKCFLPNQGRACLQFRCSPERQVPALSIPRKHANTQTWEAYTPNGLSYQDSSSAVKTCCILLPLLASQLPSSIAPQISHHPPVPIIGWLLGLMARQGKAAFFTRLVPPSGPRNTCVCLC